MDEAEETKATSSPGSGKISIAGELSDLGLNLMGVLHAAWDRPERQKLQQEIESGLKDFGSALRKETQAVSNSKVSQRVKTGVNDINDRVRSAEVETRVREELVDALKAINMELAKVTMILTAPSGSPVQAANDSRGEDVENASPIDVEQSTGAASEPQPAVEVSEAVSVPSDEVQADDGSETVVTEPQEE